MLSYPLGQCALYRIGSKARLAKVLCETPALLTQLYRDSGNYRLFTIPARIDPFSSPRKERPAQEPKHDLRRIHSRILRLLKFVQAPPYLHSAIKGRSYKSNAAIHLSQDRLIKLDVRGFFSTSTESRVYIFFRDTLCCAPDVSRMLARLCTWNGVIPTGSPLSPLLSYYANKPMFDEFSALAESRDLRFTCYIDDLTFSGTNLTNGFAIEIEQIVLRHGHTISEEKTRFFRRGSTRVVTGIALKGDKTAVPNARFRKARALQCAIDAETDAGNKLHLVERMNGLIGEAATIEPRFAGWARSIRSTLVSLREKANQQRS